MAIRKSAFLMTGDAADAGDAGWGSSDANGWPLANVGLDLGGDGLPSDMPPPRTGNIPPSNVETAPPGRIVDGPPPEPDPSLDRPPTRLSNPPSVDADGRSPFNADPPPDRIENAPSLQPAGFPDRSVPGVSDPPLVDANNRSTSVGGATAESTNAPHEIAASSPPASLTGNTIYFRPEAPSGNADQSPRSGGADPRSDLASLRDHGNADGNLPDVSAAFVDFTGLSGARATASPGPTEWQAAPLAATSDDASLHVMLTGAWHL